MTDDILIPNDADTLADDADSAEALVQEDLSLIHI